MTNRFKMDYLTCKEYRRIDYLRPIVEAMEKGLMNERESLMHEFYDLELKRLGLNPDNLGGN